MGLLNEQAKQASWGNTPRPPGGETKKTKQNNKKAVGKQKSKNGC